MTNLLRSYTAVQSIIIQLNELQTELLSADDRAQIDALLQKSALDQEQICANAQLKILVDNTGPVFSFSKQLFKNTLIKLKHLNKFDSDLIEVLGLDKYWRSATYQLANIQSGCCVPRARMKMS